MGDGGFGWSFEDEAQVSPHTGARGLGGRFDVEGTASRDVGRSEGRVVGSFGADGSAAASDGGRLSISPGRDGTGGTSSILGIEAGWAFGVGAHGSDTSRLSGGGERDMRGGAGGEASDFFGGPHVAHGSSIVATSALEENVQ